MCDWALDDVLLVENVLADRVGVRIEGAVVQERHELTIIQPMGQCGIPSD